MKETYIIGFTSYEGIAGRLNAAKYEVDKPLPNSFENWINHQYNFAFIDFKRFNIENPTFSDKFYMKGSIGLPHQNLEARWNKIFDGVFYIKEMYSCQK